MASDMAFLIGDPVAPGKALRTESRQSWASINEIEKNAINWTFFPCWRPFEERMWKEKPFTGNYS
jgi:hypothetical protein